MNKTFIKGNNLITTDSYVICPYCNNNKQWAYLHWNHLKQHNKTLSDVRKEFPNLPTMTKNYDDLRLDGAQKSKETCNQFKTIYCIYCKKKLKVKKNSNNSQSCSECISNGEKNPDKRTHKGAQNKRENTLLKKYGVTNQRHIDDVEEKIKETNLKKYGGTGFGSIILKEKTINTIKDKFGSDNIMKTEEGKKHFRGDNHPNKKPENAAKISKALKGKPSQLKDKTYNEIFGKEKADNLKENRQKKFLNKFIKNDFPLLLDYFNFEFIDKKYKGAHVFHNYKCTKCNAILNKQWNSIQQGFRCEKCFPRNNGKSRAEEDIQLFLKQILSNVNFLFNKRTIIPPQELDIYIPEKKFAIEFDGLWFHSEQHVGFKTSKYHINKTNSCIKKNIRLVHIFEDEWVYKKNIVKSRLKQILGISSSIRIHARKCIIKEIEPKIKNKFLQKFHIQGKDVSRIKLGAFYKNELISVMTFGLGNRSKGSRAKEGIWELNRFCSNSNYHIPGIAGKLLTHFKRNYEWKEIFSYADRRWSNGDLYYKLGFEYIGNTDINYWYIKSNKRIHRFSLRKRPDEPKNITEKTLRIQEGYNIIWDCGSLKFKLINGDK